VKIQAAVCAGLILFPSVLALRQLACRQPIRDAVEVVARMRASDDRVATIGLPDNAVGFYARQYGFEATPSGFLGKDLDAVVARDQPAFIVVLYPERLAPEIFASLDRDFDRTHRLDGWADWGQGDVEIWRRVGR
jgi:hypothetical protein